MNVLVVLNVRIYDHQMESLHTIAEERGVPIADLLRDLLDQHLPVYSPAEENITRKLDKIHGVLIDIYSKQAAAHSEWSKIDVPEGIFLIPNSDKKGTFACQKCGEQRSNRKKHIIRVMDEEFVFGDCCFFNDAFKEVVRQVL